MNIQCDCGKFKANLTGLPGNTPGRVFCYCDDCQAYLEKINRTDLLDEFGGTQIVPVYPCDVSIIKGKEYLYCNKLSPKGLSRWSVTCCNSPIANTKPGFPWAGVISNNFKNPGDLESLGDIKARIMGKFARGSAPFAISEKMKIKDALVVLPFIIKGKLFKKDQPSPFQG